MRQLSLRSTAALAALLLSAGLTHTAAASLANGLPSSPDYFPLGVWMQSAHNAPAFKAIGVNLFVAQWKGPTQDQLAELARNGMPAITAQNDAGLSSPDRGIVKGWIQPDEPDNAQKKEGGGYGPCVPADEVAARSAALKLHDPTRPAMVNFSQGIANTGWIGRGSCHGDMAYYDTAVKNADILAFDIYPVADVAPALQGKLEYIAYGIDSLQQRARSGQSVWAFIETTRISDQFLVTPDQLRSEVLIALTHGAKGIVYFVHEWTGGFREDGIFRHPEIVDAVTRIDRTIAALAPVLNSASLTGRASTSVPGISLMVKEKDGALYVFAASLKSAETRAALSLRGIANASASVIDETRTVPVRGGVLDDDFAGYGAHIYRIPLAP